MVAALFASQPLVAAVNNIPVEKESKIRAIATSSFFIVMSNSEKRDKWTVNETPVETLSDNGPDLKLGRGDVA